MRTRTTGRFLVLVIAGFFYTQAGAQNLADFVNDPSNGATDLQQQAGNAIQRACGALAGIGGFSLEGEAGDLFARCNEMVQTAQSLQGTGGRERSLNISGPELIAIMQQVAGEELHAQGSFSKRITSGQFSNIAGRLNAIRIGGSSAALGGRVADAGPYQDRDRQTPAFQAVSFDSRSMTGGGAAADIAGSRWGWFLEGSLVSGDREESVVEDGFDFDASSLTLGVDYLFDSGVVGVSIGTDQYEADFNPTTLVNGGSVEVDGTTGSIFGVLFRDHWFFDAILSFGQLDSDTARAAFYVSNNPACNPVPCPGVDTTLQGSTDGDFISGGFSVGYDFPIGIWDVAPQFSVAWRDIDIDGYAESDPLGGGLSLAYDKQSIKSLKSILGVSVAANLSQSFGVLSPQFRVEWHHEIENDPASLIAKYAVEDQLAAMGVQGAAGAGEFSLVNCISCFTMTSEEVDTDFGVISAGLSAVFSRRVQVYGIVERLFGMQYLSSTAFSLGIRGQF